ncbi:MAG: tRNA dimethylallyltransferase, partial [Actinomycetota bacterium]
MAIARTNDEFEIVSVDAMCVYRGMDVGTAKPSAAERAEVPHHLIDIVEPSDDYTVSRFQSDCANAVRDIEQRGKRALLVGGTGLYVRAAVDGLSVPPQFPEVKAALEADTDTAALHARLVALDPDAAAKMQPTNRRRVIRAL